MALGREMVYFIKAMFPEKTQEKIRVQDISGMQDHFVF